MNEMALFADQAEAERVAQRVVAAERGTAGEIVVAVARRSSDYGAERALFSLLWTLGWALACASAEPLRTIEPSSGHE